MTSKRFITLTISLLSLLPLYKLVQACAGEPDPYDEYPSFFANVVTDKPAYTPFYYQSWLKYYDDWYDAPEADLPDANIEAWRNYTSTSITIADADSFIYRFPYEDLKRLYAHVEKGVGLNCLSNVVNNRLTKWFISSKDLEALGYLMYAKQCEPFVTAAADWEHPERDTAKMSRLLRNGLQLQKAAKKDFIRDRYNYQTVRLALYADNPARALELYETLVGDAAGNGEIYARLIALKGGAYFRLNRKTEAAYCYSLAFDKSDRMKRTAFQCFDWSVNKDLNGVLKLCKNAHERSVVRVMDGLHNYEYGLPSMQAAYEEDPAVEGLDVIMTREINKVEERYQAAILTTQRNVQAAGAYFDNYYYVGNPDAEEDKKQKEKAAAYKKYLSALNDFTQKIIKEGKRSDKAFWQLSSSYICFMQEDLEKSRQLLQAAKSGKLNAKEQDLADVLNVLYTIRSGKQITPAMEAQLLPQLKAMKKRPDQKAFRDVMNTILATAYLQQSDSVRAIYTLANGTGYADASFMDLPGSLLEHISIPKLQAARAFIEKKNKTEYERWLTDSVKYSVAGLSELEGTKYIRQFEFDKAVKVLDQYGNNDADLPDPFIAHVSDKYELTAADTSVLYSKLSYARKMVALQQKIKADPNDAAALFEYGTGLYSMTYYGKATYAFAYHRSSTDVLSYYNSNERKAAPVYIQEYYGAMTAEQQFAKAAEHTTNPELKAKALFMAAKCWQKRCETGKSFTYYDDDMLKMYYNNSLGSPYFKQLKNGSATTLLYKDALRTCGYLRDYAQKTK